MQSIKRFGLIKTLKARKPKKIEIKNACEKANKIKLLIKFSLTYKNMQEKIVDKTTTNKNRYNNELSTSANTNPLL